MRLGGLCIHCKIGFELDALKVNKVRALAIFSCQRHHLIKNSFLLVCLFVLVMQMGCVTSSSELGLVDVYS